MDGVFFGSMIDHFVYPPYFVLPDEELFRVTFNSNNSPAKEERATLGLFLPKFLDFLNFLSLFPFVLF